MSAAAVSKAPESLTSSDAFLSWLFTDAANVHVAFVFATWHEPSKPGGAMDLVLRRLGELHPGALFGAVRLGRRISPQTQRKTH